MKIGIISDTHDNLPAVQKAVRQFNREKVDLVVHLGDWCSPFVPHFLKGLRCPVRSVFGNNDADAFRMLRQEGTYPIKIAFSKNILTLSAGKKKVVAVHGEDAEVVSALIASGSYDLVLSGHTHIQSIKRTGNVLHVNPGTLSHFKKGKVNREFTIAVYDSFAHDARLLRI